MFGLAHKIWKVLKVFKNTITLVEVFLIMIGSKNKKHKEELKLLKVEVHHNIIMIRLRLIKFKPNSILKFPKKQLFIKNKSLQKAEKTHYKWTKMKLIWTNLLHIWYHHLTVQFKLLCLSSRIVQQQRKCEK